MRKRSRHDEEVLARERPSRDEAPAEERGLPGAALRLQELVGNTAATAVLSRAELQRDAAPAKPAKPPPQETKRAGATYTLTVSDVGTFDLLSFSTATKGGAGGGGGGPGKSETTGGVCSKYADEHSSRLMQIAADGAPIAEIVLVITSGDKSVKLRFKNVHITSYQTGGGGQDARPVETFSFDAGSVEMEHQGDEESPGDGGGGSWDLGQPYPG